MNHAQYVLVAILLAYFDAVPVKTLQARADFCGVRGRS